MNVQFKFVQEVYKFYSVWCMFVFIKTNVLYKALQNPWVQSQPFIIKFSKKGCGHFCFRWSRSSYGSIDPPKCTKPVLVITTFLLLLHMQDHDSGWKKCKQCFTPSNLLLKAGNVTEQKELPGLHSEPPYFNLCTLSLFLSPSTMKLDACTGMLLTERVITEFFSPKIMNH